MLIVGEDDETLVVVAVVVAVVVVVVDFQTFLQKQKLFRNFFLLLFGTVRMLSHWNVWLPEKTKFRQTPVDGNFELLGGSE